MLEWCADDHDKHAPVQAPARFAALSFIDERPFTTTFVLLHVLLIVALLASGKTLDLLASNTTGVVVWSSIVITVWIVSLCGESPGNVVFYAIDLDAERIVLHLRDPAKGIRSMTLSFDSIRSVRPFQYASHSTTCGIDIGYLDERHELQKVRVPDFVLEKLVEAHMDALRPALGVYVKETLLHDL